MNVIGRVFMQPPVDCPFRTMDRVLAESDIVAYEEVGESHAKAREMADIWDRL